MMISEKRIEELHSRMAALRQEKSRRKYIIHCSAICVAGLLITVGIALLIAASPVQGTSSEPGVISASIFASHSALGYVFVALLAFCLGALVTILCSRIRKHKEEKSDDRKN
ncbi:MAG: DUF4179 domain-containing protein [Clostridia bacterium]|nr:DUF4179 domain-containing protein [Clostridia bacterium]